MDGVAPPDEQAAHEHGVVRVVRVQAEQPAQRRVDHGKHDRREEGVDRRGEVVAGHERLQREEDDDLERERRDEHQRQREGGDEREQDGPHQRAQGTDGHDRHGEADDRVDAHAGQQEGCQREREGRDEEAHYRA